MPNLTESDKKRIRKLAASEFHTHQKLRDEFLDVETYVGWRLAAASGMVRGTKPGMTTTDARH